MKKLIKVTEENIDNGCPRVPSRCPVALAFKENGFLYAHVGNPSCKLTTPDQKEFDRILPRSASRFIRRFDQVKPVKAFNFYINI